MFSYEYYKFLTTSVSKNICEQLFERFATRANNIAGHIGTEEDSFSKTKRKNYSKSQLDEKNLAFHDALDHFLFLYFFNACLRRRLPYIIKNEGL